MKEIDEVTLNRVWGKIDDFKIFISHKTEDKKKVSTMKKELERYGIACFVAHLDINPTEEWQKEIEAALFSMNFFIAIMTEKFHESSWTDQEIGIAIGRECPIVSLRLGCDPYGFIGKYQALTCEWENAPIKLLEIFFKSTKAVDAYIEAIKKSESYDNSNLLANALPLIQNLSENQCDNIISAYNENSQVNCSHGFIGDLPFHYGDGVLAILNKYSSRKFKISRRNKIKIVKENNE